MSANTNLWCPVFSTCSRQSAHFSMQIVVVFSLRFGSTVGCLNLPPCLCFSFRSICLQRSCHLGSDILFLLLLSLSLYVSLSAGASGNTSNPHCWSPLLGFGVFFLTWEGFGPPPRMTAELTELGKVAPEPWTPLTPERS